MKKLITTTFTLLLLASVGVAQNSTVIEQLGTDNEATATQDGNNNATIYQGTQKYASSPNAKAEGNNATVTQNGEFEAFIIQGDAGTAVNSESSVNQVGTDGISEILQGILGGTATSTEASVMQNQEGNIGQIRQGLLGSTKGGSATIKQTGNANTGIIYQGVQEQSHSLNNTASITQNGNSNLSTTILQGSKLSPAAPGSGKGIAVNNSATIIQNGNNNGTNGVRIFQGLNGGTATNSSGLIRQNGDLNNAKINQGVGTDNSVADSDATIIQHSNNNIAITTQVGSKHTATVTQN